MIRVAIITAQQTYALRHKVLWPHLAGPSNCGIDSDAWEGAFSLGTFWNDQLISIGSFFPEQHKAFHQKPQYRLRAMATDPNFRGKQAGKKLMEYAFELLKQKEVPLLWCDARIVATPFYDKLGMKVEGDIYEVPKIGPHKLMYKTFE